MYVYMYECMYVRTVCIYVCMSPHTHVNKPITWSLKAACIQTKAKQSLHYTYAQVSSASKVFFFPGCSDHLGLAFLVDFSGTLQPKNSVLGLMDIQGMRILSFGKWAWPILTQTKMKSSQEALLEEISKNNMIQVYKRIFLCAICCFEYASLATLNNVFQEIKVFFANYGIHY